MKGKLLNFDLRNASLLRKMGQLKRYFLRYTFSCELARFRRLRWFLLACSGNRGRLLLARMIIDHAMPPELDINCSPFSGKLASF